MAKKAKIVIVHEGLAEIWAPLRATGKTVLFGTCHPSVARQIRKEGLKAWLHLVHLNPDYFPGKKNKP